MCQPGSKESKMKLQSISCDKDDLRVHTKIFEMNRKVTFSLTPFRRTLRSTLFTSICFATSFVTKKTVSSSVDTKVRLNTKVTFLIKDAAKQKKVNVI